MQSESHSDSLRAQPTKPHSIDFIDLLRGLAVLSVFAFHSLGVAFGTDAPEWNGNFRDFGSVTRTYYPFFPLAFGGYGVAMFFVISGFCIHLSYEKSSKSWWSYASRRFCRIYPPYLLALLAIVVGTLVLGSSVGLRDFIFHLLLIHNFEESAFFTINPSFWSIATEVQLYLLYPCSTWQPNELVGRRVWSLFGIELTIRILRGYDEQSLPFWLLESPLAYSGSWTMGAWLANSYLSNTVPKFPLSAFIALAVAMLACYFYHPTYFLAFTCAAALSVALLGNRLGSTNSTRSWPGRAISYVGLISYSVYLFHQPICAPLVSYCQTPYKYSPRCSPGYLCFGTRTRCCLIKPDLPLG